MLPSFEFATATRIRFGCGTRHELPDAAAELGRRALLVCGADPQRSHDLRQALAARLEACVEFPVSGEPTVETAAAALSLAREQGCDLVIGLGGGSPIDTGKAVAALLTNPGEPLDYLEVVGRGRPITEQAAPFIAVPTTAGPGAEVTRNAVLRSSAHQVKVSLRSVRMLPRLALIDPELTRSLPPAVTAATGLDALTQLVEPFLSPAANPLTDAVCREGLRRVARSLRRCWLDGNDLEARQDMALAALCGGIALANARLGAAHGFAGPLGGMFPAPHGVICARFLPHVLEANLHALERRQPSSPLIGRFAEVAELLTGRSGAQAADGVAWIARLCEELEVPRLATFGVTPAAFGELVRRARASSSMKGNPIALSEEELLRLVAAAVG